MKSGTPQDPDGYLEKYLVWHKLFLILETAAVD